MSEIEHYVGLIIAAGYDESDVKDLVFALRERPSVEYAVLMADGPEKAPRPEPTREQLAIMGREFALIDRLTASLQIYARKLGHAASDLMSHRRSESFEVLIHHEGEPTGHVARVTVELDRFDSDLVEACKAEQARR